MILFVEYLRSWNEMYFALCMKNDLFQILPRQMLYLYGWTFGLSTSAVLSTCWYVAIDKNGNYGAHKIFLSGTVWGAVSEELAL